MVPPTLVLPFAQSLVSLQKYFPPQMGASQTAFITNVLTNPPGRAYFPLSHAFRSPQVLHTSAHKRSTANHATRTPSHVFCTYIADNRARFHRLPAGRQGNCVNR